MTGAVKNPCIVCAKNVTSNSIACSVCDRWIHAGCSDLGKDVLKYFEAQQQQHGTHNWCCVGCNKAYATLKKEMRMMDKKSKEMEAAIKTNTDTLKVVVEDVKEIKKTAKQDRENAKKDKEDMIQQATSRISEELTEREARKGNVVIYGLPEPPPTITAGGVRMEADKEAVSDLFNALKMTAEEEDIKFVVRIGKQSDQAGANPRPLKINFRNLKIREQLFNRARKLPSTSFNNISIVPDLTDQQRREDKEMYARAERKNAEMNDEEAENFVYRCIGRKGQRTIAKMRRRTEDRRQDARRHVNRDETRQDDRRHVNRENRDEIRRSHQPERGQMSRIQLNNTEDIDSATEEEEEEEIVTENADASSKRAREEGSDVSMEQSPQRTKANKKKAKKT